MKVVLTKTHPDHGIVGEIKEVSNGYARNFLLPRNLAVVASDPRATGYRKAFLGARQDLKREQSVIRELAEQWRGKTFELTARASDDGTLYGSIGIKELKKLLGRDDFSLTMPPIKTTGTHQTQLTFGQGMQIPVTVIIHAEGKKK